MRCLGAQKQRMIVSTPTVSTTRVDYILKPALFVFTCCQLRLMLRNAAGVDALKTTFSWSPGCEESEDFRLISSYCDFKTTVGREHV